MAKSSRELPRAFTTPTAWQWLSQSTLSVAAIREVDRIAIEEYQMHSLVLMENAAAACARWMIAQRGDRPRAVILCGRGNNGGDGLALMRHLQLAQWECQAIVLGPMDRLSPDALANWRIVDAGSTEHVRLTEEPQADDSAIRDAIEQAEVIVDAMLGSGASGQPREPFASWIAWSNAAPASMRVAIDIPTGLDAQNGDVASSCFRADATLSFVARKPGFDSPAARTVLGHIEVMPIGIPQAMVLRLLQSLPSGA